MSSNKLDVLPGVVFREEEGESVTRIADLFEASPDTDEESKELKNAPNLRVWSVQNVFSKYTYWTREKKPSTNDKHVKWVEWMNTLAPTLHSSLSDADLQKPLKHVLEPTPSATEPASNGTPKDDLPERQGVKRSEPSLPGEEEESQSETKKRKLAD